MITLSKSGSTVTFTFDENSGYLQNGTIDVPVNSLSLVIDSSNMATFRKAASNDIFVSARYEEFGMSKAELESWYKDNMVGETGGGGGVDSGTVQTMIDESISGKADTTAVTEAISEAVSGKADISDIPDVSNYFDGAEYDSGTTRINFYHGNTIKAYIDASAFIVDGMIDDVRIETISGVTYLVIDFNTASGKEDIQIPLTDIFDPSNYYTKQEVDASLSGKADTTAVTASINAAVSGKVDTSVYTAYTAATDARFAEDELASGEAFNDLNNRVNELSGNAISSGEVQTLINESVSGKQDTLVSGTNIKTINNESLLGSGNIDIQGGVSESAFTAYTAATDARIAEDEEVTAAGLNILNETFTAYTAATDAVLSGKQDTLSAGTNITISGNVISAEGGGKAVSGGTNISITTGETADTINCTLPISGDDKGIYTTSTYPFEGNSFKSNNIVFGLRNKINKNTSGAFCTNNLMFGSDNNIGTGEYGYNDLRYNFVGGDYNKIYAAYAITSSFIAGHYNEIRHSYETSFGLFNASNTGSTTADNTLFSVGNGTADNARHNAFEIRQNGDIYITSGGTDIKLQDNLGGGGGSITIDPSLDSGSTNAVANSAITTAIDAKLDASAITTSITSASTDVQVASAKAVYDKLGGLSIAKVTQAEYDALVQGGTVDANTLYIITNVVS